MRALACVDSAIEQIGQDARLEALSNFIKEQLESDRQGALRSRAIAKSLEKARQLERAGQAKSALFEIETTLKSYPRNAWLQETADRLRAIICDEERQEKISRHNEQIERALARGSAAAAEQALKAAQKEFPREPVWQDWQPRIAIYRRKAEIDLFQAQVREAMDKGELESAERLLLAKKKALGQEAVWLSLSEELSLTVKLTRASCRERRLPGTSAITQVASNC